MHGRGIYKNPNPKTEMWNKNSFTSILKITYIKSVSN